jgi:hypothetical protein
MTKEKWTSVLGNILDNFQILEHEKEFIDEDGGVNVEYIVFISPLGKVKLEFIEKPVVIGKKTNYSNRIGSETAVQYLYSDSEKSTHLEAYRWDESSDEWLEMEAKKFSNL